MEAGGGGGGDGGRAGCCICDKRMRRKNASSPLSSFGISATGASGVSLEGPKLEGGAKLYDVGGANCAVDDDSSMRIKSTFGSNLPFIGRLGCSPSSLERSLLRRLAIRCAYR